MRKNKYRKKRLRRAWWHLGAAINVAETTDCLMLDDEGYEIEYSLWKPGGWGLKMADVEKLALRNNKNALGR